MNNFVTKRNNNTKQFDDQYRSEGFTMIEFLIYIVIVTFMLGALVLSGVNIMGTRARVTIAEEVNHNGKMALNMIANNVRRAESIINPTSGIDSILSLEVSLPDFNPTVFEVSEDGVLTIKRGNSATSTITAGTVNVSNFSVENVSRLDTPGTVKVELTIEHPDSLGRIEYSLERVFYTSENVRR